MAKRKIGSGIDNAMLLNIGLIGAGYFLILDPILKKFGIKDDPAVKQQEQTNNTALLDWKQAQLKKQAPTKTEQEWKMVADTIYEDLRYSGFDDNNIDAIRQLLKVQNDSDVALLVTKFAKRQEYWFGINRGTPTDLSGFIVRNFSSGDINKINASYAGKGIKFRF